MPKKTHISFWPCKELLNKILLLLEIHNPMPPVYLPKPTSLSLATMLSTPGTMKAASQISPIKSRLAPQFGYHGLQTALWSCKHPVILTSRVLGSPWEVAAVSTSCPAIQTSIRPHHQGDIHVGQGLCHGQSSIQIYIQIFPHKNLLLPTLFESTFSGIYSKLGKLGKFYDG